LDAICKNSNIKSDLLNFTYSLKDDDRGQLINVFNSGNNKSEYDKIKANIRSEIERPNAVEKQASPSALSSSRPLQEVDNGSVIGASSSPLSPSRQLSEEDGGGGEEDDQRVEAGLPEASSPSIQDNAEDNAAVEIQRRVRGYNSRRDQRSVGGRRRTKKSKYYNKRRRTKGRRVKRRRSNKRRN
jgi:hypothetical protein